MPEPEEHYYKGIHKFIWCPKCGCSHFPNLHLFTNGQLQTDRLHRFSRGLFFDEIMRLNKHGHLPPKYRKYLPQSKTDRGNS